MNDDRKIITVNAFGRIRYRPGAKSSQTREDAMAENHNLGADLVAIWKAGTVNYPAVALEIGTALAAVDTTERGVAFAFQRPEVFGGGTFGPVYQRWRDLRDDLATVLNETRANLTDTAEVLRMAVILYNDTDTEAAAQLKQAMADNGLPYPPTEDTAGGLR
jgi:hypothetical protein